MYQLVFIGLSKKDIFHTEVLNYVSIVHSGMVPSHISLVDKL